MQGAIDPDTFDAIVIGTGLPESILAAAAASTDRKVLHIDAQHFYGSDWASVTPDQLTSSLGVQEAKPVAPLEVDLDGLGLAELPIQEVRPSNGEVLVDDPEALGPSGSYSLDVAGPKLLFGAGSLVELLLKSGATTYLEYKSIDGTLIWDGSAFSPPPTTKSELFQLENMALAQLRRLSRFYQSVLSHLSDPENSPFSQEDLGLPFLEFMKRHNLTPEVQRMVIYGIVFLDEDQEECGTPVSVAQALQVLAMNMASKDRFPKMTGSFLYTLYGQGELPQAFCRSAAVKGALYVLRKPVASVLIEKETGKYKGIHTSDGQLLYSDKLVLGSAYKLAKEATEQITEAKNVMKVAKLVCIAEDSLHPTLTNVLLIFPPKTINENISNVVRVLQLGSNTSVCPRGKFVIQFSTLCSSEASGHAALRAAMEILLGQEASNITSVFNPDYLKPRVVWSAFYVDDTTDVDTKGLVVCDGIGQCPPPGPTLDYTKSVEITKKMFHQLFGSEEWFPRAEGNGNEVESDNQL